MRTNNEDIFYEASSLTGVHINKWGDIPIDVLVEAWKQAIEKHGCVAHTNADDTLKSAWEDFLRCDKDRDDAFRGSNSNNINCKIAAEKRYSESCLAWSNTRQRFIDLVNIETGKEPIWDTCGCTTCTGQRYEY